MNIFKREYKKKIICKKCDMVFFRDNVQVYLDDQNEKYIICPNCNEIIFVSK